jgi:hypothetical protein
LVAANGIQQAPAIEVKERVCIGLSVEMTDEFRIDRAEVAATAEIVTVSEFIDPLGIGRYADHMVLVATDEVWLFRQKLC